MDRTNETATGYTYGGQQYKKETRTDSQGNTYTVDIPTAISTAQLLPTQPMNIPQVPQDTTNTTGIVNSLVPELDQQVQGQEGKVSSLSDLLIQSYQNQAAIPGQQAEMEKAAGIADTQKEVLALQNRLRALGAQAQSNILSEQNKATGQNITATAVQRNIGDLNRQVAIDSLTTSAMLQAKQGDLALAQDQISKAIDLKYKQEENRINILKQVYANEKDKLERYDKKRADALALKLKQEERDYNEKKANETKVGELVMNAASQGAPSALIAKAQAAKTPMEAAAILGQYSGDYLKNELLREQLKTERAQRAKIYAEIGAKNISGTTDGQVVSATDLQKATANLKLTEAQSKALAFGQRAINADRALRARLESYDPTTIFSSGGRLLRTDNARAFQRDLGDFITAVLRKESGATITEDEFDRFIPLYSPQGIMTNKTDIAQTNIKRQGAIDALISEAGPASAALAAYKNAEDSFISTGNQIADEYIKNSMNALSKVNTSMSTPNAVSAGYVDNQK